MYHAKKYYTCKYQKLEADIDINIAYWPIAQTNTNIHSSQEPYPSGTVCQ